MDDRMFRTAMGKFATGVTVIVSEVDGEVHGMTANAFMSVSLDPKLVLISVGSNAKMNKIIQESQKFSVNILSGSQKEMSMIFAGQIKEERKVNFDTFEGLPVIENSLVSLACNVYDTHEAGDHTLYIGEVINLNVQDGEPLAFYEGKYKQVM
ncbi:NADH-FMN oxidoreductase RutF, flavin reductase (DIM6/NTAB) family [Thalassobacillus cyri]|uniref:NADH-FMN oxidoreductase RutF, flavin reductase (DIM6/NTAB) family n=1 Tax=Thalassobacillus cyri TaxID=571932 RepID=A0A1H4ADM4_9BACI|nr:flavin reductase family protein [Thalassobacillus cyri]SEA34105.1 NADH-FMN oxidoreductase RutF, flavin reductase (DIM6/NTAB) family [Thalassobacillus cyri]